MRKVTGKVFIYSAVFLLIIAAVIFAGVFPPAKALADPVYDITVVSVTRLNRDGERVPYEGAYSKGVQIEILINSPSLKVEIYENTGGQEYKRDWYTQSVSGGKATINVNRDGSLRVVMIAELQNGTELKRVERRILSDNAPPPAPVADTAQLDVYRVSPFNFAFTPVNDPLSELDPVASRYTFTGTDGTVKIENNLEPLTFSERFIPGIDSNGVIRFELYDKAGNKAVYSYIYSRYGVPESDPPEVTLSPATDYARKVTVEISWGEDYDSHPLAVKEYSLQTAAGSYKRAYTEPFDVETEGINTLIVYYYQDGAEKSVTVTLPYIDRTPPGTEALSSSFTVYCDLTDPLMPLYASVRAVDAASGIKEVRFDTGEAFTNYETNLYKGDITGKQSFVILAEDNAGNVQQYAVLNIEYDYAGVAQYAALFASLNREDYTASGWEKVVATFRELSMDFVTETSSSDLAESKRRATAAAQMGITFITRINSIPEGLSGAMKFDFSPETLSLKKGGVAIVYIDKAEGSLDDIKAREEQAKTLSGLPHAYSFNLKALTEGNAPITISGGGRIEITLPAGTKDARIYYYGVSGLVPLSADYEDGKISLTVYSLGDFYLVSEPLKEEKGLVIGGKFYKMELLIIAASAVVGGSLIAGVTAFLINKRKKR